MDGKTNIPSTSICMSPLRQACPESFGKLRINCAEQSLRTQDRLRHAQNRLHAAKPKNKFSLLVKKISVLLQPSCLKCSCTSSRPPATNQCRLSERYPSG